MSIVDVRALVTAGASSEQLAAAQAAITDAVSVLRRGALVAVPTETVYGLAARALDARALAAVFEAKGRPTTHPLIAHVLDLDAALRVASDIGAARALAAAFWPGPLTFILPRRSDVPDSLSGGLPTVAVRAPAHPVARALIAALGEPIAAPSANRYQHVSPTEAQHVARSLGDKVSLILDGGPCARGIESTVVDLVGPPRILRLGPITLGALRQVMPEVAMVDERVVDEGTQRASPGLDARHYAPSVPAHLVDLSFQGFSSGDALVAHGDASALVARGVRVVQLPREPGAYANGLYAALHTLESEGVARIFVERVPDGEAWDAVRDRLSRATTA